MPRRSKRSSPNPSPRPPKDPKAADLHLKGKPPPDTQVSNRILEDLESGIIENWNLPEPNINTCVESKHWPRNEPDPKRWHIDIIHLLHEASMIGVKEKDSDARPNNGLFRSDLTREISQRKLKNKSRQGQVDWMTVTDLKVVIKRLHSMAKGEEWRKAQMPEISEKANAEAQRPGVRRGRSKANNVPGSQENLEEAHEITSTQREKTKPVTRGRGRAKKDETDGDNKVKPADLPIRPARKLRGVKSLNGKMVAPPPVTPSNPPEPEDSNEEEEDQENEPPEPVSGRHIYGDFIKPTTIDFVAGNDSEVPAQAKTRQTRKRGRADNEKPPTEEQIDSDPRDIDATGFLSELDPKEARRRRKPRLSRLQDDVVLEPAWSQDVPLPETPLLTPATDGPISGTPAAPVQVNGSPAQGVKGSETPSLGIKLLLELLPGIPDNATKEERSMLEDRVALIHRDIVAYKTAVTEINMRATA
ncbi:hypothetical protein E8E12_006371 [Didymella heteroderae]|uniref:Uncharacterized protein n=1 Tax=Didymella heteroderae TaxID=1769908 RepID=A0A9P5C070_9PLEO|nr:hypothetical protein E8E12_006371 [Didymella heteroderae]